MAERPAANPYPGPRPFVAGEKLYGRDQEVTRLFYLLSAERIVVLHSPSGAGKSSLLNAGLVPRLRRERFYPWSTIRLSEPTADGGNRFVQSAIASLEESLPDDVRRPVEKLARVTLPAYVAGRPRHPDAPASVVLLFDQFEEVLTLDPLALEAKRVFFGQLGETLENPEVWALFALREDYLGALDPYRGDVPTRLANTFRVDLLTVDDATDAISRPALDAGRQFGPDAAEQLANDLATVSVQQPDGSFAEETGVYVEPLQLQVVCRRLWDALPADARTIGKENLLASGDVDAALGDYYDGSVAAIAGSDVATERALREWFGGQLITAGGIRGQVLREQSASGGLDNDAIDRLVASHLVRSEQRDAKTWFELAHDRLVGPVRASNTGWFEKHLHQMQRQAALWERDGRPDSLLLRGEELKEAQSWARANTPLVRPVERDLLEVSLAKRRAQRRRRLLLATVITVVAALAILAGVSWQQAAASRDRANRAAANANSLLFAAPAEARVTTNLPAALLLALRANQFAATAPAGQAMRLALARARSTGFAGIISGPSTYPITSVAVSPDGKTLAVGGSALRLWNVPSRGPGPVLPSNVGPAFGNSQEVNPVLDIAFSSSADKMAGLWTDGSLRLWDLHGKPRERDLVTPGFGNEVTVSAVAFSADGDALASGDENGKVSVWNLSGPRPVATPLKGSGAVATLAFSPQGKTLALVGADGTVRLRDLASPDSAYKDLAGAGHVAVVAFSPDGKTLATAGKDGKVRLWALTPGGHSGVLPGAGRAAATSLVFSGDGRTLASLDTRTQVRLWTVASGRPIAISSAIAAKSIAFTSDGRLVTGGGDGKVRLWTFSSAQQLPTAASALAFSPDGKTLAVGEKSGAIRLWNPASRKPVKPVLAAGGDVSVLAIVFSNDTKTIAAGDAKGAVRVWNLPSGKLAGTPLPGSGRPLSAVALSPDGKTLATAGQDGKVELWDVHSGKQTATPVDARHEYGYGTVATVAFSSDGTQLASGGQITSNETGGMAGNVWVWDVGSGHSHERATSHTPLGADTAVASVAVSPGETVIATGENTIIAGKVRLRDTASLMPTDPPLTGSRGGPVSSVAFDADGKRLAGGYTDGTVRLWELDAGKRLGSPLTGGHGAVTDLAFSPDGKTLAGVGADGKVRLWRPAFWTDISDLQNQVCGLVWGNLSPDDWARVAPPGFAYRPVCPR